MRGGLLTNESPDFGVPGRYQLYRAGNMDAPNGMVFLSASPEETATYAFSGVETKSPSGGKTWRMHDTFEQYEVDLKNPLVVSEGTDRDNVIAAWKALHPGQDPNVRTSGLPARKWQQMDKQNAKALQESPYDAIIYKKADGRHEVQIPKSQSNSLKKTNSYKYEGQLFNANGEWVSTGGAKWKFDKKKGFTKS